MYYREWLCVRKMLIVLAIGLAGLVGLVGLAVVIYLVSGGKPSADASQGMTGFVAFVGTTALLAGGVMATVLGAALSNENDGHLEAAWTKPVSRTEYASAVMLVDAAGISIAIALGLVAHALIHAELSQPVSLQLSGADLGNLLRFVFFPFAWYAVIVAFSAQVRGHGNQVQALAWPIALILIGLRALPLGPVWHALMGLINVINPLIYIGFPTLSSAFSLAAGSGMSPIIADFALVLLAVGGWAVATTQWRRLEA